MATVKAKNHTIQCEVSASFGQVIAPIPKVELQEWLDALPNNAKIEFSGIRSGNVYFTAKWTVPMTVFHDV